MSVRREVGTVRSDVGAGFGETGVVIYSDGHREVIRLPDALPGHEIAAKGGAPVRYEVRGADDGAYHSGAHGGVQVPLPFQYDTVAAVGPYGLTNEALLAVVIDRLEGFERGPFPCAENRQALEYAKNALHALQVRTSNRVARGVEGKHEV